MAWLPILEENQGTLSLAALALALGLALWEQQRANAIARRQWEDEIYDAIVVVDLLISELEKVQQLAPSNEAAAHGETISRLLKILQPLPSAHAKSPLIALALVKILQVGEAIAQTNYRTAPAHEWRSYREEIRRARAELAVTLISALGRRRAKRSVVLAELKGAKAKMKKLKWR